MFTEQDLTRICCDSRTGYPHHDKCVQKGMVAVGRHSVPHGESSTAQGNDSAFGQYSGTRRQPDKNYQGQHREEDQIAGSDVPPRDGSKRDK